ncbi:MAG: hypothetical protein KC609_10010 [Myxococcales bacterium]|nr:hypothetical protein [Myxococcales bacterium]
MQATLQPSEFSRTVLDAREGQDRPQACLSETRYYFFFAGAFFAGAFAAAALGAAFAGAFAAALAGAFAAFGAALAGAFAAFGAALAAAAFGAAFAGALAAFGAAFEAVAFAGALAAAFAGAFAAFGAALAAAFGAALAVAFGAALAAAFGAALAAAFGTAFSVDFAAAALGAAFGAAFGFADVAFELFVDAAIELIPLSYWTVIAFTQDCAADGRMPHAQIVQKTRSFGNTQSHRRMTPDAQIRSTFRVFRRCYAAAYNSKCNRESEKCKHYLNSRGSKAIRRSRDNKIRSKIHSLVDFARERTRAIRWPPLAEVRHQPRWRGDRREKTVRI